MNFSSEADFENHLREIFADHLSEPEFTVLAYKTVADIIVCCNTIEPAIFFIEVKYFQFNKRLGFGNNKGMGIQPEMLVKKPKYLESHVRWLLGSDTHDGSGYWFVSSDVIRKYAAGGSIGVKQNNIQEALFREVPSLSEADLVVDIKFWLNH